MLGELFLSTDDGLESLLIESGPEGRVPCVSAKGLTPVSIAALGELLAVAGRDEVLRQCGNQHRESESGESGVWDVPASVVEALRGSENLDSIAEQWVMTEELQRDGWPKTDGLRVLSQLAELLSDQEPGQILWYWWSL